jgi:hypothetical protein
MDQKKKLSRSGFKKKEKTFSKKMGWYWLGLVAAALLFVGASSVPRGDSAVEVGLLLAAMAALLWGVIEGLSATGDKEPTFPTNPNNPNNPGADPIPGTGIQFGRFSRQVSGDDIPWCVATRYRITYVANGVESDPGPSVNVVPSLTETDPVFTLNRPVGVEVKWYRAVDPDLDVWLDHTSQMEEVLGQMTGVYYVDRFNPCDTPFRPEPPSRPEPFGTFEGMWNATAGQGVVPWCVPTRYRARYVRGNQASAWSEESVEFYSQIYTQPGLRVEPREGYTIEWIVSSNITLPAGNSGSGRNPSNDRDAQHFQLVDVGIDSIITWYFWLELSDYWVPGSTNLTISLTDFVNAWNTNLVYDPEFKQLYITPEGKLALDPIPSDQSETIELDDEDWPGWWMVMGFNKVEPTNQLIVASRLPRSNIVHIGPQFVDTNNMCRAPNPPLDPPEFVRWSGSVSSLSSYPWCTPTKYRYAYVVNGVQSDWSPESEFKYDPILRGPVFQIKKPQGIDGVVWERAVGSSKFDQWSDHTDDMVKKEPEFQGSSRFIDTNNPCDTPYVPDAPSQPQTFGTYGNMWNAQSGEGEVPWCVATRYRARYVRGGQRSAWSEPSIALKSLNFTNPGVSVPQKDEYEIEWRIDANLITLPCQMFSGSCILRNFFTFELPDGNRTILSIDMSAFHVPGSASSTIGIADFIAEWNQTPLGIFGKLYESPETGTLVMAPFFQQFPGVVKVVGGLEWWLAMGFDAEYESGPHIAALRPPSNDSSSGPIVDRGDAFVDLENPCQTPNAPSTSPQFTRWSGSVGALSPYPWCKPTKYRYAYVLNGFQSDWSPASAPKSDPILRDPVYEIVKPAWIGGVRWQRAVSGSNFDEWSDHTDDMIRKEPEVTGTAQFVDRTNPCQTPFVPNAPDQPQPNGVFGNNMWNQTAGEGVVPWCEPTTYVARYVSDTLTSDWSLPSVVFQSMQYTVPSLTVEPSPGFQVEWARKTPSTIFLTCTMVQNMCSPQDVIMVVIPNGTQRNWPVTFGSFYEPTTSPNFIMGLREFVAAWNRSSQVIGRLELLRSGKLALALNPLNGEGRYTVIAGPWWDAMGFPPAFNWQPVLEATRAPHGDPGRVDIIGSGDILNDVDNPCLKPNPPLQSPDFFKFDRDFSARRVK